MNQQELINKSDELLLVLKKAREEIGPCKAYHVDFEKQTTVPIPSISERIDILIKDIFGEVPDHNFKTGEYTWRVIAESNHPGNRPAATDTEHAGEIVGGSDSL